MRLIEDLKEFFNVNHKLEEEKNKSIALKANLDEQLSNLKMISKTIEGEVPDERELSERQIHWLFLKKNCFLEDIEDVFSNGKKEEN